MTAEPDTHCRVSEVTHWLDMPNEISPRSIPERDTKGDVTCANEQPVIWQSKGKQLVNVS